MRRGQSNRPLRGCVPAGTPAGDRSALARGDVTTECKDLARSWERDKRLPSQCLAESRWGDERYDANDWEATIRQLCKGGEGTA